MLALQVALADVRRLIPPRCGFVGSLYWRGVSSGGWAIATIVMRMIMRKEREEGEGEGKGWWRVLVTALMASAVIRIIVVLLLFTLAAIRKEKKKKKGIIRIRIAVRRRIWLIAVMHSLTPSTAAALS